MERKIAHGYVLLDSRINIANPRKRLISHEQLQTGKFCCLLPTRYGNYKHKLHCSGKKLFHEHFLDLIEPRHDSHASLPVPVCTWNHHTSTGQD